MSITFTEKQVIKEQIDKRFQDVISPMNIAMLRP
jgi:hypothetical protein